MKPYKPYSKLLQMDWIDQWPQMCSGKLDGFRCVIGKDHVPLTQSLKPVANEYIRKTLTDLQLPELDGELLVRGAKDYNEVQSALSSHNGKPNFVFRVFDARNVAQSPFKMRYEYAKSYVESLNVDCVEIVRQYEVSSPAACEQLYESMLNLGLEGLIVRSPDAPYKFGRSGKTGGGMFKMKPTADSEGTIIDVVPLEHNHNEAKINRRGETERSHSKAGKEVSDTTVGAFVVSWQGVTFNLTARSTLHGADTFMQLANKAELIGAQVKFAYQEVTAGGKPRFPRMIGFRPVGM